MIQCPIKKTVYGPVNSLADLEKAISKSGQHFGVDESGPACNYNASYPCNVSLYQHMGWGPHKGLDIPVVTGTEIYASHDGVVRKTSESLSQGIGVVLRQEGVCETVYWHNKNNVVKVGDTVKAGDLIAYSDNTGMSGGPHLHWEYKPFNGTSYEAVDPIPHLTFNKPMTQEEVRNLYRLAFYREPDAGELAFWTGKVLGEFLKTALKDRAEFLQKP